LDPGWAADGRKSGQVQASKCSLLATAYAHNWFCENYVPFEWKLHTTWIKLKFNWIELKNIEWNSYLIEFEFTFKVSIPTQLKRNEMQIDT